MVHHIAALKNCATTQHYRKNTALLFQGEVPRHGTLIESGVVRAYTVASSGDVQTIAFYLENDILPLSWLMDTTASSLFYYEAMTDVTLQQFSKHDF